MTGLVASRMTYGTTAPAAYEVMAGIAGRVNRHTTAEATWLVVDHVVGETTTEVVQGTAAETAFRTMHDTAVPTIYETTLRTTS
jgi:hypothetical protein